MQTTPELRRQFELAFSKIKKLLPVDVQNNWDSVITWKDEHSYPDIPPQILQQLPPAAKATYISLLNKLSRGKI